MQPRKGFLVWLGGLSVLGFLATDMYLPAFAAMQEDLQTPAAAISASLSLFLAGFAFAQLLWGPLSDRFGRKPVLLLGLAIFAVGCLGMLWVRDAAWLLVVRFIQAVGVCAAAVTCASRPVGPSSAHSRRMVSSSSSIKGPSRSF